jgi:hypothetical protein
VRHQAVPDALAHGRRAGRHQRRAREHDRGRLALARVRHDQGRGLARGPRRDPVHVPRGAQGGDRARKLRPAVLENRRRENLSARVRRPEPRLRQRRASVPLRVRGGPDRARDVAHAVRPSAEARHAVFRRVLRARPHHGPRCVLSHTGSHTTAFAW